MAPDVSAYVAGVTVYADQMEVEAIGRIRGKGTAGGMSVSSGLSMGASTVIVTTDADVDAYAGGTGDMFYVRSLRVAATAEDNPSAPGMTGEARAMASAGGLLLGTTSTYASALHQNTVAARILDNTFGRASGTVSVQATHELKQQADANSAAYGLVGRGRFRVAPDDPELGPDPDRSRR